ncbi:hypothetical protein INR49_007201, partial [Caranx melampygus]
MDLSVLIFVSARADIVTAAHATADRPVGHRLSLIWIRYPICAGRLPASDKDRSEEEEEEEEEE